MQRLLNEPVIIASVVQSGIALGIAFGLHVTPEQLAAIMAFTGTVLALLARAVVTPNQLAEARVAAGGSPTEPRNGIGAGSVSDATRNKLLSLLLLLALGAFVFRHL